MKAKAVFLGAAMLAVLTIGKAEALYIDLEFDRLPSLQGWTYEGGGIPEIPTWWNEDNDKLFMNTLVACHD